MGWSLIKPSLNHLGHSIHGHISKQFSIASIWYKKLSSAHRWMRSWLGALDGSSEHSPGVAHSASAWRKRTCRFKSSHHVHIDDGDRWSLLILIGAWSQRLSLTNTLCPASYLLQGGRNTFPHWLNQTRQVLTLMSLQANIAETIRHVSMKEAYTDESGLILPKSSHSCTFCLQLKPIQHLFHIYHMQITSKTKWCWI